MKQYAEMIDDAENVIIVPGYGLCAANAQHDIAALSKAMQDKGEYMFSTSTIN